MIAETVAIKTEVVDSFERGIDRESPRTNVKSGGYEDAVNMLLQSATTGGKHPTTLNLDVPLDPLVVWPAGSPTWAAPFTYSTYNPTTFTLSYLTTLLVHRDTGQIHRYDAGAPGTVTNARRGFQGANRRVVPFVYDEWLCVADGRNAPMKYGQHFLWSGQLEGAPYMFPLGARPITPMDGAFVTESWVHTGGNAFVADASVPQGARVGAAALKLVPGGTSTLAWNYFTAPLPAAFATTTSPATISLGSKPFNLTVVTDATYLGRTIRLIATTNTSASLTGIITAVGATTTVNVTSTTGAGTYANWSAYLAGTIDFTTPPKPYGGSNMASVNTNYLLASFVGDSQTLFTGSITIRFQKDASNYFQFTFGPAVSNGAWGTLPALISTATSVGAPDWTTVNSIKITSDTTNAFYMDDFYFLYSDAPPAFAVATSHKGRIVAGGSPVGSTPGEPFLSRLVYSNAGNPDNFPSANVQAMSGGFDSLAETNRITAVHEYQDSVIVGMPSAIFAWTIGDSGAPAKSTISTEHGIDSHRGVCETPNGSLLFPWQRGIYILRSTGRQYVGAKIQPFLEKVALDDPDWTMALIDEGTKTARFWFRTGTGATGVSQGIIFDYVRSQESAEAVWPSTMSQMADWAVPAIINGRRVTLTCRNGDPQIYVLGQGTTGTLPSSLTLPWMATTGSDHVTKWMGCTVAYAASAPVNVSVRYANNPGEFDGAAFSFRRTLPANPTMQESGAILFGGTTRWVQVRFDASAVGFEIFPPVHMIPVPTDRRP